MNHKRKRAKSRRAGCLLCKPNKLGQGMENKIGHSGFGKLRRADACAAIVQGEDSEGMTFPPGNHKPHSYYW